MERSVPGDHADSYQGDRNYMTDCNGQYEKVCKDEFAAIHTKLDRLDEAIRGNGKPGLQLRLDRLEAVEKSRSKLTWLIAGVIVTLAITAIWQYWLGG